ncbi:glycosyltransferase family 4 protein [Corallincola platygyrae]|uniref:Glycosyltransferase family 4 protein n=1 Tax=Corallincola platygyrae TaxID=1193278 RepID=A0ABW4XNC0_9GAMM
MAKIRSQYKGKLLVSQVGKLLHHKGVHLTIDVARRCQAEHPSLQFLILGSGPEEEKLKALATGLRNLDFLGHQQDIGNYLSATDILLFPSLTEGLGSTILEAWQHKAVVIGSEAGGIPDLIEDHQTGRLIPAGDTSSLFEVLIELASDPDQREKLCEQASNELKNYSIDKLASRYLVLYGELCDGTLH